MLDDVKVDGNVLRFQGAGGWIQHPVSSIKHLFNERVEA